MSATLNIRFVLQRYFPYGGQQRDFLKVAVEALRRGHRVQALVQHWEGEIPPGLDVITLPVRGHSNHRRQVHFADAVRQYRDAHPVDCQIGFIRMPGLDLYFAADPCYQLKAQQKYGRWLRWLPRVRSLLALEAAVFSPQAATQVLALTEQSISEYRASYQTPTERFHLLPPAVSAAFQPGTPAQRQALRQHYGLRDDAILLLMVGSHFKTKGVDRSIAAMAALPDALRKRCQLWVAGAGNAEAFGKQASAAGLADSVRFLGGRDDVAKLMQAADLLLQPSRTELAGMTIVEALASGLPVIASAECGYAYHVQRAAAGKVIAAPFSADTFVQSLATALDDNRLSSWRTAAQHYAQATDLRGMAVAAVNVIESVALTMPDRRNGNRTSGH